MAVDLVYILCSPRLHNQQVRSPHVEHWDDVMCLKLPANSFLVVGERARGNVYVHSKCTSFAGECDVEFSKMLDCESASVSSTSISRRVEFWKIFFLLVCHLFVLTLIRLFCRDIFPPILRMILCFWFLNWIKKFSLSVLSLSLQFSEGRLIIAWIAAISYNKLTSVSICKCCVRRNVIQLVRNPWCVQRCPWLSKSGRILKAGEIPSRLYTSLGSKLLR